MLTRGGNGSEKRTKRMIESLRNTPGLDVYEASVVETQGAAYFLARREGRKLVGCIDGGRIAGEMIAELDGKSVYLGPMDHANAEAIRAALPWTAPQCLGLATTVGLGDRLGLATPGHIRAVRGTGLGSMLAQQSIREMNRTNRTPEQVMDAATWGVLQEGFKEGFGSDADHLQDAKSIDATLAAGFTLFTIDPGKHVENNVETLGHDALAERFAALDFEGLGASASDLMGLYVGKTFALAGGSEVLFDELTFHQAAVKYGNAIAHTVRMYEHLSAAANGPFEMEVSVDETDSPTTTEEHYFFAAELKRLGVKWVSLAPRFVGQFEKGVDYIGDMDFFRASLAEHVAVMRTLGPYKLSIHSGSDKFSIYPIIAELADGMVHLKTAGTSYLEAIRAIAAIDPPLFREILDFARANYEADKATYHVSADVAKVPPAETLDDADLPGLLDQFDARQALHVTFGSVLTCEDGGKFGDRIRAALDADEETHYAALQAHLAKHVQPFAQKR